MDAPTVNVLSLCAGAGGLDLGVKLAVPDARTVCYVENEVTACGVLVARMEEERLDDAPLWTDLRTFEGKPWRGLVQAVIGGYPCQPFSVAGRQRGADDPRHLWPEVRRIVSEVQPRLCFFENVAGHLRLGFSEVAADLREMGYDVAAALVTASEVGAPHGRERLFILAVADANSGQYHWRQSEPEWRTVEGITATRPSEGMADAFRLPRQVPAAGGADRAEGTAAAGSGSELADSSGIVQREPHDEASAESREWAWQGVGGGSGGVGDTDLPRLGGRGGTVSRGGYELAAWPPSPTDDEGWRSVPERFWPARVKPEVRGMVDGVADGVGLSRAVQLHILGNGVVPQQAAYAFRLLSTEFAC